MACKLCNEIFSLCDLPAHIYWITQSPELNLKINTFLKKRGFQIDTKHELTCIHVKDTHKFFEEYHDDLDENFHNLERKSINIFLEYEETIFSIQNVIHSKPLSFYISLIEDRTFFDILDNESITSYFQPIVHASNHSIFGYEMLARGVYPDGSLMQPGELFSKSARNDTNFRLDSLCRESALKTAATKKVHQKIFINFLPTTIYDPEFCLRTTIKWAEQFEFDPQNIVFEVVETEKVEDQNHLQNILQYYRDRGFKIALDDVGEGYSNLNMLLQLQPDIVKVDRNIIKDINKDNLKQSIYEALYKITNDNGIKLLAEGVETQAEKRTLKQIGVDYFQGYFFAKPSPEPVRSLNARI